MLEISAEVADLLVSKAMAASQNAYAPYSGFKVGAALLCDDGEIFTGCNVENSAYPVTNCAERTAVFTAVAAGKRSFKAIAIVAADDYCYPCGSCRQVLSEFANGDFVVLAANNGGKYKLHSLSELLPYSFKLKR